MALDQHCKNQNIATLLQNIYTSKYLQFITTSLSREASGFQKFSLKYQVVTPYHAIQLSPEDSIEKTVKIEIHWLHRRLDDAQI